ncbi:MFS transporter [Lactococcus nasutitermitis]|uniref:MFS transporter n=1 Tax=Lactococcus nasutitermitis TaxID=1652957 RepID=A0ABV9JFF1_9LACT|nr:MFS transporter [Lactococcus nasutitermitis]
MNTKLVKIFSIFLFGNLTSQALSYMIDWHVLRETGHATDFALIIMLSSLVALIAMPFIGTLVDRKNHKHLLLVAQIFEIVSLLIFFIQPYHNLVVYILLTIALSLANILFLLTMFASVAEIADNDEEMMKINGIQQGISTTFSIIAPPLAGFLLVFVSVRFFALIEIFSAVLVLFVTLSLTIKKTTAATAQASSDEKISFHDVLRFLFQKQLILSLMLVMVSLNFILAAVNIGIPYFITHQFAGNTKLLGIIETGLPIGMILASFISQHLKKIHLLDTLRISYSLVALSIILFGVFAFLDVRNIIFIALTFLLCGLVLGAGQGVSQIPMLTFLQKNISEKIQGRTFSIIDTFAQILVPIGLLMYGFVYDHLNSGSILIVSGLVLLLFIIFISKNFKNYKKDDRYDF